MRNVLRFFVCSSLVLFGCGGDDGPTEPDAGNLIDQCLASGDQDILLGTWLDAGATDGGVDASVEDPLVTGGNCARDACIELLFLADPAPGRECMESCYGTSDYGGLSSGCQSCFIDAIYCSGYRCTTECLGTSQEVCTACTYEQCGDRLYACTGY